MNWRTSLFSCITISVASVFICSCSVSDADDSEYSKWSFSGKVVDSENNLGLQGAVISYQNGSGKNRSEESDKDGNFFIDGLPYGARTFNVSYSKVEKNDTLYYAPKVINVSSVNESSHMEGVVATASSKIRLSPLSGSFIGEVYLQEDNTDKKIPVSNLKLSLAHRDTNYVNLFPETFYGKTDSLGKFSFSNLPADTGLTLTIAPYTHKDLRYVASDIALPTLRSKVKIDIGRVYLVRDTLIEKSKLIKASNVADERLNGYRDVSPQIVPFYVFSHELSTSNLSVTVKADSTVFYVKPTVKGDTLFLNHDLAFPSESRIYVNISAYEKKSGDYVNIDFTGDSAFVTDRGIYAVTSNAWNSNEKFKAVFGTEDTIWVKFSKELSPNVDRIKWNFVKDKSIYASGDYGKNADAWINKDTLFVKMMDKMVDSSRKTGDSVWMNITVFGKDESSLQGFVLGTELKVPAMKKIKGSNVVDKSLIGYMDLSPKIVPYFVFEEELDTSNLSVSVKADSAVFYVIPSVKKDTLFLNHDLAFPAESRISMNIVGYGKNSGERIAYDLKGDSAFVTGRGIYGVTSNTWPSNKKFKSTFAVGDTIWVKFSQKLSPNVEQIQWNTAKKAKKSINANGANANAKAWIATDTLFIQMKSNILDSCKHGDSVGVNITVYADDDTYMQGFTLYTELEVPPQSSSSQAPKSSSSTVPVSSSSVATSSSSEKKN